MINWLTENIGTGAYLKVIESGVDNSIILDVRDMVDKDGNSSEIILKKIEQSLLILEKSKKVVICCDYGMSRSNSIAVGTISKYSNIEFDEAVKIVKNKIDEAGIKIEMLNAVYKSLNKTRKEYTVSKNILVTGGSGFLGKNLISKLKNTYNVFSPSSNEIELINGTISLDLILKNKEIDTIIHLANPKIFTTNKSVGDTLIMLKNILDLCRTNNIKLIFLSGWEIYTGYKSHGLLANENLEPNPKGTYGETKWLCELLIKKYVENYNVKCQIIRSGPVYGSFGEKPKFLFNFLNKALTNQDIITHKYLNGFPSLDILYIGDLVNAINKICDFNSLDSFNIGSGRNYSTLEIAELIVKITNSKSKVKSVLIEEFTSNIIMDNSKSKLLLDWIPEIELEEGLTKLINNYKQK
jgi:UDP-glucuronate decarboxylase